MNQKIIPLLGLLFALVVSGCSTVEPGKRYGSASLESMKTAFVVIRPDYDPKIGAHIHEALTTKHGVSVATGSLQDKPKDVAFYVEYEDHWRWDLAMYLHSLDIRFINNLSGEVIGMGSFRQGFVHDFPDAREKTLEVVKSIYKAK